MKEMTVITRRVLFTLVDIAQQVPEGMHIEGFLGRSLMEGYLLKGHGESIVFFGQVAKIDGGLIDQTSSGSVFSLIITYHEEHIT